MYRDFRKRMVFYLIFGGVTLLIVYIIHLIFGV
jgi:hypothetical protein